MSTEEKKIRILSIDAWRYPEGWTWNNWHKVGECPVSVCDLPPRKLFAYLRKEGLLGEGSAGMVACEDDGFNIVILARANRQPLFALEYGAIEHA